MRLHSASTDSSTGPKHYSGIDELHAASEAAGWSIDYRQIQSGPLVASARASRCGNISLMDERVSRRVEVVGTTPQKHVTIVAPTGRPRLWFNGYMLHCQNALLLGPGVENHALTFENTRVQSVHIPISLLCDEGFDVDAAWKNVITGGSVLTAADPATSSRLRLLIHALMRAPAAQHASLGYSLLARIDALMNPSIDDSQHAPVDPKQPAWRVVRRAREYIDFHLGSTIHLGEVCDYAATSLSKLERTFQQELQLTPSNYIHSRRLAAVNKALKVATNKRCKISDIAMQFGFNHLGRFSGAYRTQFGELPSETIRAA